MTACLQSKYNKICGPETNGRTKEVIRMETKHIWPRLYLDQSSNYAKLPNTWQSTTIRFSVGPNQLVVNGEEYLFLMLADGGKRVVADVLLVRHSRRRRNDRIQAQHILICGEMRSMRRVSSLILRKCAVNGPSSCVRCGKLWVSETRTCTRKRKRNRDISSFWRQFDTAVQLFFSCPSDIINALGF